MSLINLLIPGEGICLSVMPIYRVLTIRNIAKYNPHIIQGNLPYFQTFSLITSACLYSINNFQYIFGLWAITDLLNQSFQSIDVYPSSKHPKQIYNYTVVGQFLSTLPGCYSEYRKVFSNYSPTVNYWNFNTDYLK